MVVWSEVQTCIFTKLHDRHIPNIGVGPVEFQLNPANLKNGCSVCVHACMLAFDVVSMCRRRCRTYSSSLWMLSRTGRHSGMLSMR